jgi:hypothetical protein
MWCENNPISIPLDSASTKPWLDKNSAMTKVQAINVKGVAEVLSHWLTAKL